MTEDTAWPPKSPLAALSSSPNGHEKYHNVNVDISPTKGPPATPSLLERLRAARANRDVLPEPAEEVEEDEETLQLQLAAIEAKLKLKKLQQKRAEKETDTEPPAPPLVPLPSSTASAIKSTNRDGGIGRSTGGKDKVQVGISPMKRSIQTLEPKSPNRVLLGIDKGMKAADVSLERAKPTRDYSSRSRDERLKNVNSRSARCSATSSNLPNAFNSFSERMVAVRDGDRLKDLKRGAAARVRSTSFKLNPSEVDGYRVAAEQGIQRSRSPVKPYECPAYSREDVLLANTASKSGKQIVTAVPRMRSPNEAPSHRLNLPSTPGNASLHESFSGIDLASRILPHTFLQRTLPEDEYKIFTLPDLLRSVVSPGYELPSDVGNYVVFGIIAAKSAPRDHKQKADEHSLATNNWERKWEDGSNNNRKFIVMTLTDLDWSLDLFLFGTAVPRYHRLTPGTLIAILNPSIMPPKKGKEDTGAFSLTLHNGEDTVLEIGQARNLGYCSATRKDGKVCGQWINAAKTEVCDFHLNLQLHRTQSQRMGINAGHTAFGGIGGVSKNKYSVIDGWRKGIEQAAGSGEKMGPAEGKLYSQSTGHYYVSGAAPSALKAPGSAAPFVADAQESRDKKALLKKRQEAQAREAEIARKLGLFDGGKPGSEYLRHRSGTATGQRSDHHSGMGVQRSAMSTRSYIMRSKSDAGRNGNGKRTADSIRLSPVKKTRFLTEKGIKEAGRESLNATKGGDDDYDDDDLEIV